MSYALMFFTSLIELLNAMSPYLLLGFLFAGILKVWFPKNWIDKYMGKGNLSSVINTTLLGIPLPLCSCGVIPTGISFYKNGASKGASISFLISTPQTGVDSILVTYSLLGIPFAIIRVIIAILTGIIGGIITNIFAKENFSEAHTNRTPPSADKTLKKHSIKRVLKYGFYEFLMDIAKWLVIGILIAAFIGVIIPEDFFTSYLSNEPLSMLIILIASIPLYICATASVPIAAILMLKGLSPGAALVLLMAGPATNAATITVIKKVFGNKTLFSYLSSIIAGALLFGTLINLFFPREWFIISQGHQLLHQHELLPIWFKQLSSILLLVLIINGYIQNYLKKKETKQEILNPIVTIPNIDFSKLRLTPISEDTITLKVEGMTCSHCKTSVEKSLNQLPNITSVTATPAKKEVQIKGTKINLSAINSIINGLGYTSLGKK